jgi:AcrR family transcriptional regulator
VSPGGASGGHEPVGVVAEALFSAVDRLLAQGGSFGELTPARIADEAGVSRQAFYAVFPDTTALALQLLDVRTADVVDCAVPWIEGGGDRDELAAMILELTGILRRHALVLRTQRELGGTDARVRGFWFARVEGIADVLAHRLRREHAGSALNATVTASWIAWGTERTLTTHIQTRPASSDEEVASGIANAIWGAMHQIGT